MWTVAAIRLATTIAAMYGGNTHTVLKNPATIQKMNPVKIAAVAISGWLLPLSMCMDVTPRIGAATIRPIPQDSEVHCNGEKL